MAFEGLTPELPAFLAELAANNERAWFAEHKAAYQDVVQGPLRELVAALAPAMLAIDPAFDVNPTGAAVSRIHRDTRFSRDKSPYRVNQWICFKRPGEGWQGRPAFFLEIGPSGWRYGMGYYAAPPSEMKALRERILALPGRFADLLVPALEAGFDIEGEEYARPRMPEGLPLPVQEWTRRKSAYLVANRPLDGGLYGPRLVEELQTRWQAIAGLYQYLSSL